MHTTPSSAGTAKMILGVFFGLILAVAALASILSAGTGTGSEADQPARSSVVGEDGAGSGIVIEPGRGSVIYDGGSITTGDDGELIYSDNDGNSFSSGGFSSGG
jgi:hypothetical protein